MFLLRSDKPRAVNEPGARGLFRKEWLQRSGEERYKELKIWTPPT